MRIIAGDYKGRKLSAPYGERIRPTADKVKGAIFNMIDFEVYDSIVVDLFSGTGNIGLEALSRGAKTCYFCDNARESIEYIKQNVKHCKAEEQAVIMTGDYASLLKRFSDIDIVFLDPPYHKGLYDDCFQRLDEYNVVKNGGLVVAEYDKRQELPESFGPFIQIKNKRYGKTGVAIYEKRDDE